MSQDRAVTLAVIIGAHGVTGEVRLKLFSDDPARLKQYKVFAAAGRTLTLKNIRAGNNGAIARFAEITDRNTAEALRGTELCVPRSALPLLAEGEYYHADLIGLGSEEHTSELQSLMRISYAVFCLKKKKKIT